VFPAQGKPLHTKNCPQAAAEYRERHPPSLKERIEERVEAGARSAHVRAAGVKMQEEADMSKGSFSERRRLLYEATREHKYCRNTHSWSY